MSDGFRPSVASASIAFGDKTPLVQRPHPLGQAGAKLSLEEVAKRIREGRLDPRIRAWAGEALIKAGRPKNAFDQAQALLDALRKQAMYAPDPVGSEMIVAAKNTLCLDDGTLCMRIGDCDDLCVALGSALMSIGIPTKIVGQAFDRAGTPSHVLLAVETKLGWKRVDPSSDKFRVGEFFPATKEWWLDPMEATVDMSNAASSGDFVGVGRIPMAGMLGDVGIWVYPSDIEAEKARVNARWISLATDVDACWSKSQLTPEEVRAFYIDKNTWDLYNEKDVSVFGLPSQMAEVSGYDNLVYQWQLKFKGKCQVQAPVTPPAIYANPSILPSLAPPGTESTLRTIAVAGAFIVGGVAAIYGIGYLAQISKKAPQAAPQAAMANPWRHRRYRHVVADKQYEVRFVDPIGRERMVVVTAADDHDAAKRVKRRYTQPIRVTYVHKDV